MDYSKLSDQELLKLYNAETGGIPLAVVKEVQERGLVKTYTGTFNSNMTP